MKNIHDIYVGDLLFNQADNIRLIILSVSKSRDTVDVFASYPNLYTEYYTVTNKNLFDILNCSTKLSHIKTSN